MKRITNFWIYGNTFGVMNNDYTLIAIGKEKAMTELCNSLNQNNEDYIYYVVRISDDKSTLYKEDIVY